MTIAVGTLSLVLAIAALPGDIKTSLGERLIVRLNKLVKVTAD
jgi:hypothetical protein